MKRGLGLGWVELWMSSCFEMQAGSGGLQEVEAANGYSTVEPALRFGRLFIEHDNSIGHLLHSGFFYNLDHTGIADPRAFTPHVARSGARCISSRD